ncbi:MAG: MFS family permease, partial [Candidatus Azotimanducaceae bacterium]
MSETSPHRRWSAGVFIYRDYRFLWLALMTSSVVVWMRILGTAQWLLEETGSAYYVGLIGVVQLVVQLPVTLWAGTLADRVDRKRLMSIANAATGLALLSLGFLNAMSLLTPTMVYVGIAITAATHMLASPATSALMPIIIPERQLMLAASTDTASRNAAAIAGPLLFAFVAVTANLTTVFFIAGAVALSSSILPFFIRAEGKAAEEADTPKVSQIQQTI